MPLPYWKKKALARRPRRRAPLRRRKYPRSAMKYMGSSGLPDRAVVRLKFVSNNTMTAVGSSWTQQAWRMNSIYDPDFSLGGHQPYMYDVYSGLYARYRVFKCVVEHDIVNQENEAVRVGQRVAPDDSNVTQDFSAFEAPRTYSKIVGGVTGQNRTKLRRAVYVPRALGMTPTQYRGSTNTDAPVTANPNTQLFDVIFAQSVDGSTVPNIAVATTITYYVEFYQRKEQMISASQSS